MKRTISTAAITLRKPTSEDGIHVHALVSHCPPLDPNSSYCNLLQCHHFADTSIIAEKKGKIVGFISGYLIPNNPNTLFIWQIAIDQSSRGQGLASAMLHDLLRRADCSAVNHIHTTITKDNPASWAVFEKLTKTLNTTLTSEVIFDQKTHFAGQHDSEHLVSLGPFELNT